MKFVLNKVEILTEIIEYIQLNMVDSKMITENGINIL